jgi:hypothetical protein
MPDRMKVPLTALVRFLLWDYERGSLAYDIACLLAALLLFLVPPGFWGDPLWPRP